ncbi:UNVERIFIED_CONTAM: FT-interacting protein 3 [Sesamum radiatum]|uniref:FT-interacting protein 3 n=1 Tax=Sesamum radiatum TaxID=300843 RepID=A0AAW2M5D5_SESRA
MCLAGSMNMSLEKPADHNPHAHFVLILVCYPELILPTLFLYLFVIGLWNYRFRPREPPHMDAWLSQAEDAQPDELQEEFEPFPTSRSLSTDIVRMRYDRMRTVAGRVQTVTSDLAMQGERVLALLNWRDPRATTIFRHIFIDLGCVLVYYSFPNCRIAHRALCNAPSSAQVQVATNTCQFFQEIAIQGRLPSVR